MNNLIAAIYTHLCVRINVIFLYVLDRYIITTNGVEQMPLHRVEFESEANRTQVGENFQFDKKAHQENYATVKKNPVP